ncbi:alpha/beta fold hydrolase [Paracoccus sp. TK19116]|uniref:Alpha/beta fold hydrolase n=1 Tax=Paracoccus albicereus TaxID=2922394 RepID=A0ABT1MNH8_9RHOB|nr:alpha/beta fold hydrolase [Paracoccus albicereus]MCQ0969830.1 alpha/beta fold hydrolase [Paracoccus albicereus]
MMLKTTMIGDETAHPVLLAHGLFGQGRNLGPIARTLVEQGHRALSVDMRNHGESFHNDDHSYAAMAGDLARVIEANGGRADVVGHSMGGKAAMVLALTQPTLIDRLVVMDIAPVAYAHDQAGYLSAMKNLDLNGLEGRRSNADRRLAETVGEPGIRAFLLQSLDLKADPPRWMLNLDALDAGMAGLVGWPGDDLQPGSFDGPALFLTGETSDYVTADGKAAIQRLFPQAEFASVKGAGHWLHADQPAKTAAAVADFLRRG